MKYETIIKSFFKYVSLNVAGMIGLSCYILVDTFFISVSLGSNGLAALNFSIAVFSLLQGVGIMTGIGGATRYTISRASGDEKRGNDAYMHSVSLGVIISALCIIISLFFSEQLALLLGASGETLQPTKIYLSMILLFSPFFTGNNILLAFIRNDGNPRLAMIAMLVSSLINIVMDYVFMFPMKMGMLGAVLATCLASVIGFCVLIFHFVEKRNNFRIKKCKIKIKYLFDVIKLGFSAFVSELASAVTLIVFNLVILKTEGTIGVAAYGVISNISIVAAAFFTGTAQGMQPLSSEYYGKKDKKSLEKILKYAVIVALTVAVLIYISVFIFSSQIVSIFNSERNSTLDEIAQNGIKIYFLGFFFGGINIICAAFLSSVAKTKGAMLVSLMRSCILLVPITLVLSNFGINCIWSSFVITEILTFIVCLFIVKSCFKKKIIDN